MNLTIPYFTSNSYKTAFCCAVESCHNFLKSERNNSCECFTEHNKHLLKMPENIHTNVHRLPIVEQGNGIIGFPHVSSYCNIIENSQPWTLQRDSEAHFPRTLNKMRHIRIDMHRFVLWERSPMARPNECGGPHANISSGCSLSWTQNTPATISEA